MYQSIVFRRFVFCFLMICFMPMLACQGDEASVIVSTTDPPPDPDNIQDDGKTTGELFSAGNPYHDNLFEDLLQLTEVSTVVQIFEARGFELSPADCFTITGDDGESAGTVTFVFLYGTGRVADQTVIMACYDVDGFTGVSPAVYSVYEPDNATGWTQLEGYGWMKTGESNGINRSPARIGKWSWPYFWECMKSKAPGPMMGCTFTCALVGPGFWGCMLTCTVTQALIATAICTFKTISNGATDKKEDPK
jgi:hypothetical protein